MMYKISFVVDNSPLHYYQAELLLLSLRRFGKHAKEEILVHCTDRVDGDFLAFLRDNEYRYQIIEPFLDGKYCNKIQQLRAFVNDDDCDGVFLIDTDVFALEPFQPPHPDKFCAKIVDAPNPPISILNKIFEAADLTPGQVAHTDWGLQETLATNFNGGYYFIPKKYVLPILNGWEKWATWLFGKPELFENDALAIHTDQVAMAMALCETKIECVAAASNHNCPIHSPNVQRYFDKDMPVYMLHYHRELNEFGLLNQAFASNHIIGAAIEKANELIATQGDTTFYGAYRKSLISPIHFTEKTNYLLARFELARRRRNRPLRLILHGGTPKTGTTSLQYFWDANAETLRAAGFLYPKVYLNPLPKHQWLVNPMLKADAELFAEHFHSVFAEMTDNTHTIILSTEGIYNHWKDFSGEAKSFLAALAQVFKVELWVWFREPYSFMNSLYRQNLKNPQIVTECYGQDWSFSEMLRDKWFVAHLDYLGFLMETESIFGLENLSVFMHSDDVVSLVKNKLDVPDLVVHSDKRNVAFSDAAVELLRLLNRYPLAAEEKKQCNYWLSKINGILKKYAPAKTEDSVAAPMIYQAMAQQRKLLTAYGLNF